MYLIRTAILATLLGATVAAAKDQDGHRVTDLADMNLEDLVNVEVTSVSKKEQKLSRTPAAVFVITQDEIRRSVATSVPELLRMVPGLMVARIDANSWAVSARGFNGRFANKMLVLVDGRSVYTPVFSGVYWDALDMPLDEIDRIEVIRGPGSVMWGANAVNGVINIILKHSVDTVGSAVTAGAGTFERGFGEARYGAEIPGRGWYRAYTRVAARGTTRLPGLGDAEDEWDSGRAGFRVDWTNRSGDQWMVEGGGYKSSAGHIAFSPFGERVTDPLFATRDRTGGSVTARWQRGSKWGTSSVQAYFDRFEIVEERSTESRSTAEVEFQQAFPTYGRHQLQFGLTTRFTSDRLGSYDGVKFDPAERSDPLFGTYMEDEIDVVRGRLKLWPGIKLEVNSRTGLEVQPGVRAELLVNKRNSIWGAVSRAVRTPSRRDMDLAQFPVGLIGEQFGLPVNVVLVGNPAFGSEVLVANELGWRRQFSKRVSLDIAGFFNRYTNLEDILQLAPKFELAPIPHLVVPGVFSNTQSGKSGGVEASLTWAPMHGVRLSPGYTWFDMRLRRLVPDSTPPAPLLYEKADPRNQFNLRSYMDLPKRFSFDSAFYYVSSVRPYGGAVPTNIAGYYRFDTQISKRFANGLEIGIAGENLQGGHHSEFAPEVFGRGALLGRSAYVRVGWRSVL